MPTEEQYEEFEQLDLHCQRITAENDRLKADLAKAETKRKQSKKTGLVHKEMFVQVTEQLAKVTEERDTAIRSREFTEQWYALRFERVGKWARDHDEKELFDILANGDLLSDRPPTFAEMIGKMEAERDQLRRRVHDLTNALRRTQTAAATIWHSLNVIGGATRVLDDKKDGVSAMTFDESELKP